MVSQPTITLIKVDLMKLRATPCPHCGLRNLVHNPNTYFRGDPPVVCLSCNRHFDAI